MTFDPSLRERFWRDVAVVAGHNALDPRAIREAVEDMMRNYGLDEVPGFETASGEETAGSPDTSDFSRHSAFAPVFSRSVSSTPPSWSCAQTARPIFVGPRCVLRRRQSCRPQPRDPDHFPGGENPGIQPDADQPTAHPTPVANGTSPWYYRPQLPPWTPQHYVWTFPTGHLVWSPFPQSTPSVSPLDWGLGVPIRLSPHIVPNPNNAYLPSIDWNVTKHPLTAKRLTVYQVIVDMAGIWEDAVAHTEAHTIIVTCDVGHMSILWGPIIVKHTKPVTLRDLFEAIYHYFQVPLTYPEVRYICDLHPSNYHRLADAYYQRCRESTALSGWEEKQGFRRADVLGDRRYWWGAWTSARYGTWWLNLGLTGPSRRGPFQ